MVEAHLLQYASPVVVDALAGQPSVLVEGEEPAKGKRDPSTRGWKSAPGTEVGTADADLQRDALLGRQAVRNVDVEVRQRR